MLIDNIQISMNNYLKVVAFLLFDYQWVDLKKYRVNNLNKEFFGFVIKDFYSHNNKRGKVGLTDLCVFCRLNFSLSKIVYTLVQNYN